jgi:hypothetical protein
MWDEGDDAMQQGLELEPDNTEYMFNMATIYIYIYIYSWHRMGRREDAQAMVTRLLDLQPHDVPSRKLAALIARIPDPDVHVRS